MEQIKHYNWAQDKLDELTQTNQQERHEAQEALRVQEFTGNRAERRASSKNARKHNKKVLP